MTSRLKNLLALAALALAVAAGDARAQAPAPPPEQPQLRPPGLRGRGPGGPDRPLRALFLRVAPLSPEEQQRALETDELFQQLPPMARERFRRRLEEFNSLSPERRQQMLERWGSAAQRQDAQVLFLHLAPLPAEEQRSALDADAAFQKMPPQMQERFRFHLEEFNSRLPEERERMLERFRRFAELSPEEQREVRRRARLFGQMSPQQRDQAHRIFQAWQQLPADRRQVLMERLRHLQAATPEERRGLAEDPSFLAPLAENERQVLRGLWELRQQLPEARPSRPR